MVQWPPVILNFGLSIWAVVGHNFGPLKTTVLSHNFGPFKITVLGRNFLPSKTTVADCNFGPSKITVVYCNFGLSKITILYRNLDRPKIQFWTFWLIFFVLCFPSNYYFLTLLDSKALCWQLQVFLTPRTPASLTWVPQSRLAFGNHRRVGWPSTITAE